MKKKLQDMERLCEKMLARFGADDALVLQFRQEILTLQGKLKRQQAAKDFGRRTQDNTGPAQTVH